MNLHATGRNTAPSSLSPNNLGRAPVNRSDDFGSGFDWYMDANDNAPRYSNPPRSIAEIQAGQPQAGASWTDWIKWIFNVQ